MAEARRSWWKIAIVSVVAIELLGGLSGWLSNSGYGNPWFDALRKPAFMPPGFLFGIVWPILYALLGVAFALILAEPPSTRRKTALTLFLIQMVLNFAWSPIFFAGHDISIAETIIWMMAFVAAMAAAAFYNVRKAAGLLMAPYLAWLTFAGTLTLAIDRLNPGAGTSLLG